MDAYRRPVENQHQFTSMLRIGVRILGKVACHPDDVRAFHGAFGYRVGQVRPGRASRTGLAKDWRGG